MIQAKSRFSTRLKVLVLSFYVFRRFIILFISIIIIIIIIILLLLLLLLFLFLFLLLLFMLLLLLLFFFFFFIIMIIINFIIFIQKSMFIMPASDPSTSLIQLNHSDH